MVNGLRQTASTSGGGSAGPLDELIARLDDQYGQSAVAQRLGAMRLSRRRLAPSQTRCLLAQVGHHALAIRLENVFEILNLPAIAFVPGCPNWLLGVTNLRGDVVSVADVRGVLGGDVAALSPDQRVVVVRSLKEELMIGLVVDRVDGIRGLSLENAVAPNIDLSEALAAITTGVLNNDNQVILAVDIERFLQLPELRQFEPN